MPIFEFRCASCRETFEALVRPSVDTACPHCRSSKVEKLVSAPSVPRNSPTQPMPIAVAGTANWLLAGVSAVRVEFTALNELEKSWLCAYAVAFQRNVAEVFPLTPRDAKVSSVRFC